MNTPIAYLVAVLGVLAIGCLSIASLEIFRPGGDWNSQAAYMIVGMCTMVLPVLLGILKNGHALADVQRGTEETKSAAVCAAQHAAVAAQNTAAVPSVTAQAVQSVLAENLPGMKP